MHGVLKYKRFLIFLGACLFLVLAWQGLRFAVNPPFWTYSTTSLVQSLGYYDWPGALKEVIRRGNNPQMLEELRQAAVSDDPGQASVAEFALFRLGDQPDERFASLLNRLKTHDQEGFGTNRPGIMLGSYLGPQDSKYAPALINLYNSSDDIHVKYSVYEALCLMPDAPGAKAVIDDAIKTDVEKRAYVR